MSKQQFTLEGPVHVDYSPPREGGRIEADYEAGDHTPSTPGELELFEHLVTIGFATVTVPAKRPAKKE